MKNNEFDEEDIQDYKDMATNGVNDSSDQKTSSKTVIQVGILILLLIALAIKWMTPQTPLRDASIIEMGPEMDAIEQAYVEKVDIIKAAKEDLVRHYDDGRYLLDFSAETEALNKALCQKLEKEITELSGCQVLVKGGYVYFNDVMEQNKGKVVTIDEMLKDPVKNIKDGQFEVFVFKEGFEYPFEAGGQNSPTYHSVRNYLYKNLVERLMNYPNRNVVVNLRMLRTEVLEGTTIEKLRVDKNTVFRCMKGNQMFLVKQLVTNGDSSGESVRSVLEILSALKEKYNEEFYYVSPSTGKQTTADYYAPVKRPDFYFEADYISDAMYLNLLAQDYMNKKVEAILKKHGVEDRVVVFNAGTGLEKWEYDTSKIGDKVPFMELQELETLDTNIYVLNVTDDKLDLRVLREIIVDIQGVFSTRFMLDQRMNGINIYFYQVTKEQRDIISFLFKQTPLSDRNLHVRTTALNLENQTIEDTDTEGFRYLFSFGTPDEYHIDINFDITDETIEEILDKFKTNMKW